VAISQTRSGVDYIADKRPLASRPSFDVIFQNRALLNEKPS